MRELRSRSWRAVARLGTVCFIISSLLPNAWAGPVVIITSPAEGETVRGQVWIDVAYRSDSDLPVSTLQLFVDSQPVREYKLSSPKLQGREAFSHDFSLGVSSPHTIRVKAIDTGGNIGEATIQVGVKSARAENAQGSDTTPPVITIYYPRPGEIVSGEIQIKADATDNVGVRHVFFFIDGKIKTLKMNASAPFVDRWDTTRVPDGEHVLTATAIDGAENEARSEEVTVVVQNHQMTLTEPAPRSAAARAIEREAVTIKPAAPPATEPPAVTAPSIQTVVPAAPEPTEAPVIAALPPRQPLSVARVGSAPVGRSGVLAPSLSVGAAPAGALASAPARVSIPPRPSAVAALASTELPVVNAAPRAELTSTELPVVTAAPPTELLVAALPQAPAAVATPDARATSPAPAGALARSGSPLARASGETMIAALPDTPMAGAHAFRVTRPVGVPLTPAAIAAVQNVKVIFDGDALELRAAPETRDGLAVAALREIFEHTDGVLYWYPVEKRVRAVNKTTDIHLQIGNPVAKVNDAARELGLAPYIKHGRTMVPLQFIADTLDVTITYNPENGEIVLSSNSL